MTGRLWRATLGAAGVAALAFTLLAQQSPTRESSPAGTRKVRINFLPPPLEGTLSLGIYDGRSKLVRVLHREADVDEFEIGSDSLSTTWDGKDNDGAALPAGKYHARGYAVGNIDVEGVGYHFNDWVSADGTRRLERIHALDVQEGRLLLSAKLSGAATQVIVCDPQGNIVDVRENPLKGSGVCDTAGLAGVVEPLECRAGAARSKWIVDRITAGAAQTEVKQFTSDGELARRLSVPADEPQPRSIAISGDDRIYLLEENESTQRVRCLTLARTGSDAGQAVSDWNVEFDKKIVAHSNFTIESGKPVTSGSGSNGDEKAKVRLQPNALQDDKATDVELIVAFDATGAVLKTDDGLPLQTISETTGLKRVVMTKAGEKSLDVFQDDGAVVEQFRVSKLDQMMAFDAGDFELK